jgi:hypothetical protein
MIKQLFTAAVLMVSLNTIADDAADDAAVDAAADAAATKYYTAPAETKPLYNDCYRQKADNPMEAMMDGMEDMMDSFNSDGCNGNNDDGFFGNFFNF